MSEDTQQRVTFEGEEAHAGYASPMLDLIATALLIALAGAVMIASVALPVPDTLLTAPGLLPFLVSASLLLLAVGLGVSAVARWRSGTALPMLDDRDLATDFKSLGLAVAVAIYIASLQVLAFRYDVVLGGFRHTISAFEPVTIIALAVIITMFWRGAIWITALICVCWTALLSLVFQHVFAIPLPGSF
ncbi:MAG: hypothetical protein AAGC70_19765 [Pseudomonadota bacterium]